MSLACQSGGTVYALDAILHNPQILHPTRPYLAIGGPWVHQSHTTATTMAIAGSLPVSLLGLTDKMGRFINTKIDPLTGFSSNVFDTTKRWILGTVAADSLRGIGNDTPEARFDEDFKKTMLQHVFAENVSGLSEEAKLLLQRVGDGKGWSDWGDVDTAVTRLVPALKAAGVTSELRVDIFFAGKDNMIGDIGTKGPKWLEECFREEERKSAGQLKVRYEVIEKAEHETVWDMRWDAIGTMLKRVSGKEEDSSAEVVEEVEPAQ